MKLGQHLTKMKQNKAIEPDEIVTGTMTDLDKLVIDKFINNLMQSEIVA